MICLQCNKPAEYLEDYNGIPIGECEDGHRTGKDLRPILEGSRGREVTKIDWLDIEDRISSHFNKAS